MTHEPFFSTTDPSLTSFLRFPYDVRLQIYIYLLIHGSVCYDLCLQRRRIVLAVDTSHPRRQYPYFRHGLFPAILECCRLINDEATPILYGRNHFSVGCRVFDPTSVHILNSWPMSERNLKLITSLRLTWHSHQSKEPPRITAWLIPRLLPALKAVKVNMMVTPAQLGAYLALYGDALAAVPTVEFRVSAADETVYDVYRKALRIGERPGRRVTDLDRRCLAVYMQAAKTLLRRNGRTVTWESHDDSDEYGPCIVFDILWEAGATGSHSTKAETARLAEKFEAKMLI